MRTLIVALLLAATVGIAGCAPKEEEKKADGAAKPAAAAPAAAKPAEAPAK